MKVMPSIIVFDSDAQSFFADHVPGYHCQSELCIDYIESLETGSSTNISGSFEMAIPQFSPVRIPTREYYHIYADRRQWMWVFLPQKEFRRYFSLIATNDVEGLSSGVRYLGIDTMPMFSLLNQIATENNGILNFSLSAILPLLSRNSICRSRTVLLNTSMTLTPDLLQKHIRPAAEFI